MQIVGVIKEIVYRNIDNGYSVVKIDQNGLIVTATGKFPIIGEGESVKLEGEYKVNPKFGNQFVASSILIYKPNTEEQIEKYLCSGLIAGVGPVTAHAIVQKFGKDTFDIIEKNPTQISEIKGISLKKALEIYKTYSDIQKMQNAVIFLQKYDISINLAVKIYTKYKSRTEDVMCTNPYQLVEDIDGIGFKTADKIANRLGIEVNSPFRIRAGILYVLGEIANKMGSTIVSRQNLLFETSRILEIDSLEMEGVFGDQLDILTIDCLIKQTTIDDEEYISISSYYDMEKSIAQKLTLLQESGECLDLNIDDEIAQYERNNKLTLSENQKQAVKVASMNPVVIVTGGPGTGKTTIVKCILKIMRGMNKKCMLLAPTGRAAKRMEETTKHPASTIHRALEVNFNSTTRSFVHNEDNPLEADVVIVDESSMLDTFVTFSLLRAISLGTKLVFVGDKDQLPSVGAGNVLADIISSNQFNTVELTQIYRQLQDSNIVLNAHKVNDCEMPNLREKSKDFFFIPMLNSELACEEIVGLVKERLPKYLDCSCNQIQVIAPMKAGFCGVDNMNEKLQNSLNPSSLDKKQVELNKHLFRIGDRVMQTVNNYDLEWSKEDARGVSFIGKGVFNGDMGVVSDITEQTREVIVDYEDGRCCNYSLAELDELTLSYAITIHKSQGSEFDAVIIPIFGGNPILYNKNLLYTAITRAKKMVVLIGNEKSIFSMVKNKMVNKRQTLLLKFLKTQI